MRAIAESYLKLAKTNKSDYAMKYEQLVSECEKEMTTEKEVIEAIDEENVETTSDKICPRCGNTLVKRVSKKGKYEGNSFWGCSSYPKCRYIEQCE